MMNAALDLWLLKARGRRLEKVLGAFYVDPLSSVDGPPLALWIGMSGSNLVRLSGAPDGCGIEFDLNGFVSTDMGDAGRTVLLDMADVEPFLNRIGSHVRDAALIRSSGYRDPIGVQFVFQDGGVVLILNWGDELFIRNRPPADAEDGDIVVCPVKEG